MLLFFFFDGIVSFHAKLQRFKGIRSSWWKSINAPNTTILTAVLNNTLQSETTIIPSLHWKEGQRFLFKMIAKIWNYRKFLLDKETTMKKLLRAESCS